jgi:hypothetical protein
MKDGTAPKGGPGNLHCVKPNSRPRSLGTTPLQEHSLRIGELFDGARAELGRNEFDIFLEVLTARVAREHARRSL